MQGCFTPPTPPCGPSMPSVVTSTPPLIPQRSPSRSRPSFNERLWYDEGQYLYDVVDPNDTALRPNQIFAVSLDFPVLDESRWRVIVDVVQNELLTPVGLRSLSRSNPEYKAAYDG